MFFSNVFHCLFGKKKIVRRQRRGNFNNELLSALLAADDLVIEADKVSETVLGKVEIDNDLLLQDIKTFLSNGENILQKCISLRKNYKSQFKTLNGQREIWMLKKTIRYLKKQKRWTEICIG